MSSRETVAIFWDYENCQPASTSSGYEVVNNMRRLACEYGDVTMFKAYLESATSASTKSLSLRSELQSSGVSLTDCPHNGRKDVADKMIIVDMLAYAIDNQTPATVVLVSGDRDFAYAVSVLRMRRYRVVIIASTTIHASLKSQASTLLDWNRDILSKTDAEGPVPPAHFSIPAPLGNKTVFDYTSSPVASSQSSPANISTTRTNDGPNISSTTRVHQHLTETVPRSSSGIVGTSVARNPSHATWSPLQRQVLSAEPLRYNGSSSTVERRRASISSLPDASSPFGYGSVRTVQQPNTLVTRTSLTTREESEPVSRKLFAQGPSVVMDHYSSSQGVLANRVEAPSRPAIFQGTADASGSSGWVSGERKLLSSGPDNPDADWSGADNVSDSGTSASRQTSSSKRSVRSASDQNPSKSTIEGSPCGTDQVDPGISISQSPLTSLARATLPPHEKEETPGTEAAAEHSSSVTPATFTRGAELIHDISSTPDFKVLIDLLDQQREMGVIFPLRSDIAERLKKQDTTLYERAGVKTFGEYIALAATAGIGVMIGGAAGRQWITHALPASCTVSPASSSVAPLLLNTVREVNRLPINKATEAPVISQVLHDGPGGTPLARTVRPDNFLAEPISTSSHALAPPPEFDLLVKELERLEYTRGITHPLRSTVAIELLKQDSLAYSRVGVSRFKDYVALAVETGVVVIGGTAGDAWISLPRILSRNALAPIAREAKFHLLIEQLRQFRLGGVVKPLRSAVGYALMARSQTLYQDMGFKGFKEYAAAAEKAGIVQLGGSDGYAWMSLSSL